MARERPQSWECEHHYPVEVMSTGSGERARCLGCRDVWPGEGRLREGGAGAQEQRGVTPERALVGTWVRVLEHHRIEKRRGLVGKIVGRYGGREHVAVDVRLSDGRHRLFWPGDLEAISSSRPWWRSLLEGTGTR